MQDAVKARKLGGESGLRLKQAFGWSMGEGWVLWRSWRGQGEPEDTRAGGHTAANCIHERRKRVWSKLSGNLTAGAFLPVLSSNSFLLFPNQNPHLSFLEKNENVYISQFLQQPRRSRQSPQKQLTSPNGFPQVLFDSLTLESEERKACVSRISIQNTVEFSSFGKEIRVHTIKTILFKPMAPR